MSKVACIRIFHWTVLALILLVLQSCVSVSREFGIMSGQRVGYFREERLKSGVWLIEGAGLLDESRTKLLDFVFFHAAILAKKKSYDYFRVLESFEYDRETQAPIMNNNYNAGIESYSYYTIKKPVVELVIRVYKTFPLEKMDDEPEYTVYNADLVIKDTVQKYKLQQKDIDYEMGEKISKREDLA